MTRSNRVLNGHAKAGFHSGRLHAKNIFAGRIDVDLSSGDGTATVTFAKPMKSANYLVLTCPQEATTNDDGKVSGIQIRVPTELNAKSLMVLVSQVVTKCLELGWQSDKVIEWAKIAVRCFDPCVSCATNTKVRFKE